MSMPIIKHSGIKRCDSITDIVESVALEQTALSHILNAEGEKIQKVLEKGTNAELLKVNDSVQTTINAIGRLENILQGKLELFKECLCTTDCKPYLNLKIALNQLDVADTTTIENQNNFYKINLMRRFPRTITFSGLPEGTTTTVTAINTLPTGVTLTNNVLSVTGAATDPLNILLEVKLVNGMVREIYTINVITKQEIAY